MKLSKNLAVALSLAGSLLVSASAEAASIIIRTGVDASLAVLGENATDPFWDISVQSAALTDAEVVNAEVICCGMQNVGPQAAWISDPSVSKPSAGTLWGIGLIAVASREFDLSAFDVSTLSISGAWRVADNRRGVYINGNLLAGTNDNAFGFTSDQLFSSDASVFLPGINLIEIRGTSVNSEFDAFWLDAEIVGDLANVVPSPVPEPGTVSMIGLGVAGLIAHIRRRRARQ